MGYVKRINRYMAIHYDISVVKGDTVRWSQFFFNSSGSTFDFRGCTLHMQVKLGGYHSSKLISSYSRYIDPFKNFVEPFGYTGGITAKNTGTAYFCLGSCYSNQLTTSRPYNYDVKVEVPGKLGVTTIIRGNIYALPNATNYVNYSTGTYASEISAPKSATGYALWANAFTSDDMFTYSADDRYKWGATSYVYLGIVPAVNISGNSYNGYRTPGVTNNSDISSSMLSTVKSRLSSIPPTRRCLGVFYYWPDCNLYTKEHQTYYRAKNDGTTYSGSTFMTPWMDVNLNEAKLSFTSLLQNFASSGVTFDYVIDDKEAQYYFTLDGNNTYNYWNNYTYYGYPQDPYPNLAYETPMPDARVMSAVYADSRFSSYVNPSTGLTFGGEFLVNYKNMIGNQSLTSTPGQILARVINVTGVTAYKPPSLWWQPYSGDINYKGYTGGYTFYNCAVPAWNATVVSWLHGYYAKNLFDDTLSGVCGFENTKHVQYEIYPVNSTESKYLLKSNSERQLQSAISTTWSADAYYGLITNVIFPTFALPCNGSYSSYFPIRSGYVKTPVNDVETYSWCGHLITTYSNSSLVRYPEEDACNGGSIKKFYKQLSFKVLVNSMMFLRASMRSDSTFWQRFTPWVSPPNYPFANYYSAFTYENGVGKGYWYEMMYHLCLHGAQLFNYFDYTYNPYNMNYIQDFLDEWRRISSNSKARPCSNSTGDINSVVDRLTLSDVFENVLISGGKLLVSGKYLWRITIPPKFIDNNGNATLVRVGSDSDIPQFIDINGSDVKNSCGVWIIRDVATPPNYIPVPR
jgi:hypothetical protein